MLGLVMDIETTGWFTISPQTGTLPDDNEILEVGYLRINTDTYEIYGGGTLNFYKPYFNVESEAQKVHGLTREYLEQFEGDFDRNLIALNALVQQTCIIGKNSTSFDVPYIREFLLKHSMDAFNMTRAVRKAKIKRFSDGQLIDYEPWLYSIDVQDAFTDEWKRISAHEFGINQSPRRKGKLEEYIQVLKAQGEVDSIYATIPKTRETRAHGALYDAVMTYVVYKYCHANGLL